MVLEHRKIRVIKDKLFTLMIIGLTVLSILPLFHITIEIYIRGLQAIIQSKLDFFFNVPSPPGSSQLGGIWPAIIGSFVTVSLASLIGIPISLLTSIYIVEYPKSALSKICDKLALMLTEFPTIIVSLFIYNVVVVPMGTPTALAGALSLTIIMLPYVTIQAKEALRSIPFTYREAAYSLGLSRSKAIFSIFMGIARRGVLTSVLIGVARALGDTASILFTAGAATYSFYGLFGPTGAIPLLIFKFIQTNYENWIQLAYGAAFLLTISTMMIILILRLLVKEVRL